MSKKVKYCSLIDNEEALHKQDESIDLLQKPKTILANAHASFEPFLSWVDSIDLPGVDHQVLINTFYTLYELGFCAGTLSTNVVAIRRIREIASQIDAAIDAAYNGGEGN